MKRPEDYPQQSRFYTGLYSTKAFNAVRSAVNDHCRIWYMDVVRGLDREVVVVCSSATVYDAGVRSDVTSDYLKAATVMCLRQEETSGNVEKEPAARALRLFFEGRAMEEQSAKLLEKMRGARADDVAAEVAGCEEDEERKVKAEHDAFVEKLLKRDFVSPKQITGQYGCAPYRMDERTPFNGPVDKTELEKYFALEAEMLRLNNQLADAYRTYSDKFEEFREARKAIRRLSSETKAQRVKEVKAEFRLAKRTAQKATA